MSASPSAPAAATPAPAPAPAAASPAGPSAPSGAAPASSTAPAASSSSPQPVPASSTTPMNRPPTQAGTPAQPRPKQGLRDRLLGSQADKDLEKNNPDDRRETVKKRRQAAAGILGSMGLLIMAALATLLLSIAAFVLGSYIFPMLACKLHGFSSKCMFNPYDKVGDSIIEKVQDWMSDMKDELS